MTRTEKEYLDRRFQDLGEQIAEHNKKLEANDKLTDALKLTVKGNGGKGHEQRLDDLEKWKSGFLERKTREILARRAVDAAIVGVVVTVLLWLAEKLL